MGSMDCQCFISILLQPVWERFELKKEYTLFCGPTLKHFSAHFVRKGLSSDRNRYIERRKRTTLLSLQFMKINKLID